MLEDAAREAATRLGVVGAQAALLRDGAVEEVAVGLAHAETGLEMTPSTLCQVGSTTKVLTAVLVLQLCEGGVLDLDVEAGDVVPGLPDLVRPCTPRQLMSMTSGLDNGPYVDTGPDDDAVRRYVMELDEPRLFPPGAAFSYSNASTCVSGLLVEQVLGITWDEALRTRILEPASMTCSATRIDDVIHRRVAVGHHDGEVVHRWGLPRGLGPAGSTLCSTAGDLVRFVAALPRLMDPRTVDLMLTPQVALLPTLQADSWALGPFHVTRNGIDCWGHSGTNTGGSSYLLWVPSHGIALATVVNTPAAGYPFARAVLQAVLPELAAPRAEPVDAVAFDPEPLVGTYRSADTTVRVSCEDEALWASLGDDHRTRLRPLSPSTFLPSDDRFDGGRGWALAFAGVEHGPASHLLNGFFALPRCREAVPS